MSPKCTQKALLLKGILNPLMYYSILSTQNTYIKLNKMFTNKSLKSITKCICGNNTFIMQ